MARRRSIVESLREGTTTPHPPTPRRRRLKTSRRPKPVRKRAPRKLAAVPADEPSAGAETAEKPARPGPRVLTAVSTDEAKRVGLYLHPDDFRALGMCKVDDGANANVRVRAMIALWRHNDRYRADVDKLARTEPRGPRQATAILHLVDTLTGR